MSYHQPPRLAADCLQCCQFFLRIAWAATITWCGNRTLRVLAVSTMFAIAFGPFTICQAEESETEIEDGWTIYRNQDTGTQRMTLDLVLYPQPEPKPALRYRLIPDRFDQVDGNAAIHYVKALGFLEQTRARQAVSRFEQDHAEAARLAGEDDYPPYSWMKMSPKQLPLAEVKQFTQLVAFQVPYLRAATKRRNFDLDRNLRQEDSPLMVLLPEVQVMRQLRRYQSLRIRVALAEDRATDAIELLGQQYALAAHLGSDELFVPNLVGAAIASHGWKDAVHVIGHPDTPNLYWAFASLPRPLIDMKDASSYERQFLFEQVKCLREVTEELLPATYWQTFLERFEQQIKPILQFEGDYRIDGPADEQRTLTVSHFAAAYPGACRFLIEQGEMPEEQIEKYPNVQIVLLAMRRYYEISRDEQFKWNYLPYATAISNPDCKAVEQRADDDAKKYGWITEPANLISPALFAIRTAQQRTEQHIALAQTVEAIRMYAAENGHELPARLEDLRLPAPVDPISGTPFRYEFDGVSATLWASQVSHQTTQLNLTLAE